MVRGDSVERDGNFLPALAAEGDVDVSVRVDCRICDGMQVVGDLHAQRHGERRAFDTAHAHAHCAAGCSFGDTRDQQIFGG